MLKFQIKLFVFTCIPTAWIILLRKSVFFVCGCTVVLVSVVLPIVTGTLAVFDVIAFDIVFNSGGELGVFAGATAVTTAAVVVDFFGDTSLI